MGKGILDGCGMKSSVVYEPSTPTTADDTKSAVDVMRDADLILFVGGDGTARDVMEVIGTDIPVLGIPSGVKMYSAVFAQTPYHAAEVVNEFTHSLPLEEREVVDIDEGAFRDGSLRVDVKGYCMVPVHDRVQTSKDFFPEGRRQRGQLQDTWRKKWTTIPYISSGAGAQHGS